MTLRELARSLQSKNPFYLLSAGSMLVGCFALSRSLEIQPGHFESLAVLVGVLQVYELVLIALAAYLLRRRSLPADARTLLTVECLFLLDSTFLSSELTGASGSAAPLVACGVLGIAAVKLLAIRRVLGLTSRRTLAATLVQLSVLSSAPAAFTIGSDRLPLTAYFLWWVVGLLPLLHAWAALDKPSNPSVPSVDRVPVARSVESILVAAPFVSALLHLVSLHWVFSVPWNGVYLAPMLLGLGSAAAHHGARRMPSPYWSLVRWLTPVVALTFSTEAPDAVVFAIQDAASFAVAVTPFRLALLAACGIYYGERFRTGDPRFTWAALVCLSGGLSGGSPVAIGRTWSGLVPETAAELGLAAVVASFAFLAFGFALSLSRTGESGSAAPRSSGN